MGTVSSKTLACVTNNRTFRFFWMNFSSLPSQHSHAWSKDSGRSKGERKLVRCHSCPRGFAHFTVPHTPRSQAGRRGDLGIIKPDDHSRSLPIPNTLWFCERNGELCPLSAPRPLFACLPAAVGALGSPQPGAGGQRKEHLCVPSPPLPTSSPVCLHAPAPF